MPRNEFDRHIAALNQSQAELHDVEERAMELELQALELRSGGARKRSQAFLDAAEKLYELTSQGVLLPREALHASILVGQHVDSQPRVICSKFPDAETALAKYDAMHAGEPAILPARTGSQPLAGAGVLTQEPDVDVRRQPGNVPYAYLLSSLKIGEQDTTQTETIVFDIPRILVGQQAIQTCVDNLRYASSVTHPTYVRTNLNDLKTYHSAAYTINAGGGDIDLSRLDETIGQGEANEHRLREMRTESVRHRSDSFSAAKWNAYYRT